MQSILIDLDDTFLVSRQHLGRAIEKAYGLPYRDPDKWETYRFTEIYDLPMDKVLDAWIKSNVLAQMTLQPGSADLYWHCVDRGIHIEFVTARGFDPEAHPRTVKNLQSLGLARAHYSLTITKDLESKAEAFHSHDPILFVDDSPQHVEDMAKRGIPSFLREQPHNEPYRRDSNTPLEAAHCHTIPKPRLRTVKSMYDVIDILTYLRGYRLLAQGATPSGFALHF